MPKFQTIIPHEDALCVEALDDMLAHDPELQDQVVYGCPVGDHTGYVVVEASSEEEVRKRLPNSLSKRARVVEVRHFTPQDIVEHHNKVM